MGERTWGKGSVQNVIELENGRSALKLTTAAYKRPSGKNIHRFPDSKDKDEWGVMPDLGYELGLGERETQTMLVDRRQRDVIAAHETGEKSAVAPAAAGPGSNKPIVSPADSHTTLGPAVQGEPLARRNGATKPDVEKLDAQGGVKAVTVNKPFVDRQLQMALKYLRDELAKKDGKR